jgi:hypothetical protein
VGLHTERLGRQHGAAAGDRRRAGRLRGDRAAACQAAEGTIIDDVSEDEVARLRDENAELKRLLMKHQWSGLTPIGSIGACPECAGTAPPLGTGHRAGCALAAALDEAPLTA